MAKKNKNPNGDDSDPDKEHLLAKVAAIGRRMDSVEEIVGWLAHAEDKLPGKMLSSFGTSRRRAQVYLALDGVKNAVDIAKVARTQRQNVDVELRALRKKRLVDIVEANGRGVIYRKRSIDAITGLSDALMKMFNLDKYGRPLK